MSCTDFFGKALLRMKFEILFLTLCGCVLTKEIPSYVHLCKRNDPAVAECFINTIYEIMPHLVKGIPEMNIPPIDPLEFAQIKVSTGDTGSVNMDIELLNGTVSGLQYMKMENHKMDFDKIRFSAILKVPNIRIEAAYRINGKILLFQLNGLGHASFNASDIITDSLWTGSTYSKKDGKHVNIDSILFKNVQLKNMRVKLDNLFGNNVVLTETVNNAINNNIDSLQDELEPIIKETLVELIRDYFNRVYRLFPMDQLYPID